MSIDAIGSVVSSVSSLAASKTQLATGNKNTTTSSPPPSALAVPDDVPDATVVAISDEAAAQQQAAEDQAAQDAAAAADVAAVTDAVSSDWAAGAPPVDNAAVQEALDALDEASRENNVQLEQDAITAQQDQADLDQKAIDDAATAAAQQEDDLTLAAINSEVQVAYGSLSTPITGDPALRQPGKVDIVA